MKKTSIVIKWYKVEHWLYMHNLKRTSKIFYHIIQILFGCSIPPKVMLEENVDFPHYHGIVIHQDTIIHEGTLIYQNVTIGGGKNGYGCEIGKNCFVGAGACILGKIKIGDNVKIGANAVVLSDVPEGSTVVGVPGKIVKRNSNNDNNKYNNECLQ